MALSFMKISKGITLAGQSSAPSSPVNGDIYYDTTLNSFQFYQNGAWTSGGGTVLDGTFRIQNTGDVTKQIAFSAATIATGTTRTITMPNADVNLGSLANINLSNLGTTAINAALVPSTDQTFNLGSTTNSWTVVRGLRFSPSVTTASLPNASWTAGGNTITFSGGTNPITQGATVNMSVQGFTGLDLGRSKFIASLTSTTIVISGTFLSSGSGTLTAANLVTIRTENATGTTGSSAPTIRSGNVVDGISGQMFAVSGDVSGTGASGVAFVGSGTTTSGRSGNAVFISGASTSGTTGDTTLASGDTATGTTGFAAVVSGNATTSGNTGIVNIGSGNATSGNSGDVNIFSGTATGTRGSISLAATAVNVNSSKIINLATPTASTDAANKSYVDANAGSTATSGTRAAPNSISAGGAQALAVARRQVIFVQGNAAAVTMSLSAPFTGVGSLTIGDQVILVGRSDTNTVTLANVSGSVEINGDCTLGASDTISLVYDGTALIEVGRS